MLIITALLLSLFTASPLDTQARPTEYYYNTLTRESTWQMPSFHGYSVAYVDADTGRRFWQHEKTGETTWQSPGDWEEIYGEETPETPYYVHRKTRETTWTKPEYLAWTRVEHDWKEEEDGNEEEKKEDNESVPEEGASKKKGSWFSSKS